MTDQAAPEGKIFVCAACGKTSVTLYGDDMSDWDESCMLHAVLANKSDLVFAPDGRRVVEIKGKAERPA